MQSGLACMAGQVESICRVKAAKIIAGFQTPSVLHRDRQEVANQERMDFKDVLNKNAQGKGDQAASSVWDARQPCL